MTGFGVKVSTDLVGPSPPGWGKRYFGAFFKGQTSVGFHTPDLTGQDVVAAITQKAREALASALIQRLGADLSGFRALVWRWEDPGEFSTHAHYLDEPLSAVAEKVLAERAGMPGG